MLPPWEDPQAERAPWDVDFSDVTGGASASVAPSFGDVTGGASWARPRRVMPDAIPGALPHAAEARMLAELAPAGIGGALLEGGASILPSTEAWAAKVNRLGALPFRLTSELVGPDTPLGQGADYYGNQVEDWARGGQAVAEAAAAEHQLAPSAGIGARLVHSAIAGAGPTALGMGAAVADPALGAAVFGVGGGASTYAEARDRGQGELAALAAAAPRGIAEAALAGGLPSPMAPAAGWAGVGSQAAHGAATMAGFEGLQLAGETATGRDVPPWEQVERVGSAALTGLAMSGLPAAARQALAPRVELAAPPSVTVGASEPDRGGVPTVSTEGIAAALREPAPREAAPWEAAPPAFAYTYGKAGWSVDLRQQLATAIDRRNVAEREARTDPLTGLANRRALDEHLPAAEADPNTAVISFDANGFGQVNKKHGESVGDRALVDVADAVRSGVQQAQQAGAAVTGFRRGGDEFVVTAPAAIADQVRQSIEDAYGTRDYGGVRVSLTGSVGDTFAAANAPLQAAKAARKAQQYLNAPVPQELPARGGLPRSFELSRDQIDVRPDLMQYKDAINDRGETGRLSAAQQWKPALAREVRVWQDPESGRYILVDGHQRIGLYDRLGATAPIRVSEVQAPNAREARAQGALLNLAEGSGTVWDAAKVMRDYGWNPPDLEAAGVALTEGKVRTGLALKNLDDWIFRAGATGKIPESQAVIIGEELPGEPAHQASVYREIADRQAADKPLQDNEVRTLARLAKGAGTFSQETEQANLFGGGTDNARSLMQSTLDVYKELERGFTAARRDYKALAREDVAKRAASGEIGTIDTAKGTAAAERAAQDAELFQRLGYSRPASDFVTEAARRIANGENRAAVIAETRQRIVDSIRAAVGDRSVAGRGPADAGRETTGDRRSAEPPRGGEAAQPAAPQGVGPEEQARLEREAYQRQIEDQGQGGLFEERRRSPLRGSRRSYDDAWADNLPPEVKALRRQMALLMHPDRATDEAGRARATAFLSVTNAAADRHSLAHMQAILEAWHRGDAEPPPPPGYGRRPPPQPPKQDPMRGQPPRQPDEPPPGVRARRGVDTEPVKNPVELPEIVELLRRVGEANNRPAFAKVMRRMRSLGAYNDSTKQIELAADLFANPDQAASTMAHEIGHYIDAIPEDLRRGNILGSLASLFHYGRTLIDELPSNPSKVFTEKERAAFYRQAQKDHPNDRSAAAAAYQAKLQSEMEARRLVDRATVQREVIAVSKARRGNFSPTDKYRNDPRELYADAFSTLINRPAVLKRLAPTFHSLFFNYLDRKPGVREAYQAVESRRGMDVYAERQRNLERMSANDSTAALLQDQSQREPVTLAGAAHAAATVFVDKAAMLYRLRRESEAKGSKLGTKAVLAFESRAMTDAQQTAHLARLEDSILRPLEQAGVDTETFGRVLLLRRAATERAGMANPLGIGGKYADRQLSYMAGKLGPEKWAAVERAASTFSDLRQGVVDRFLEQDTVAPALAEKMRTNRDYARFVVNDLLESDGAAEANGLMGFRKQFGTLREISDPFVHTVLQDLAIIRATAHAESVNATRTLLAKDFPGLIREAETNKRTGQPLETRERGMALLRYRKAGETRGVYVPDELVSMYQTAPNDLHQALVVWSKLVASPLRAILVTHNPAWAVWNIQKDVRASAKNVFTGALALPRAALATGRALVDVVRSGHHYLPDEVEAMSAGAMLPRGRRPWTTGDPEDAIGTMMVTHGLGGKETPQPGAAAALGRVWRKTTSALAFAGEASERASKVAAWRETGRQGLSTEERAYVTRNLAGTPNTRRAGAANRVMNALFLFSNVSKEGWRSSYEAARRDPVSWALKTVAYDVLPKVAMVAAAKGLLGAGMQAIYDRIPQNDKENYLCVPLGLDENGKAVYIPIPQDHVGQALGGIAWAALNGMHADDILQVLDANVPWSPAQLHPGVKAAEMARQYALGQNPRDEYRGRSIMPDQVRLAGGARSHLALARAMAKELGGSIFLSLDPVSNPDQAASAVEAATQIPGLGNIVKRFVRVSDYGLDQQARDVLEQSRTAQAERGLTRDEAIREALSSGSDLAAAFRQLRAAGNAGTFADFKARATQLRAREFGDAQERIRARANSKAERKLLGDAGLLAVGDGGE